MSFAPVTIVPSVVNGWCFCVATGPSLRADDVQLVAGSGVFTFGVNDVYRLHPAVDVLYACDGAWWDAHWENVKALPGEFYSPDDTATEKYNRLNHIQGVHRPSFSTKPDWIHYGNNSGFQVMNLAYLMGYRNLVLLGYDMGPSATGSRHFFGEHSGTLGRSSNYPSFIAEFKRIQCEKLGLRIINATRRTYLDCFEKMELEESLELAKRSAALP